MKRHRHSLRHAARCGRVGFDAPLLMEALEPRLLRTVITSPAIAGDVNADGTVDIVDLTMISQKWQQPAAAPLDQNGDGIIDIVDYTNMALDWQQTVYDGRTAVVGGTTNVWVPDPVDAGTTWTAAPTQLYGPAGKPSLNDIQSGGLPDSYLLAAIGAVGASAPTAISNNIVDDGTGWAVYFDGSQTGQASAAVHVSRQFSDSLQPPVPGAGVWWQVVEKAYAWYRTFNGVTSENSFASLEGGSESTVLLQFGQASTPSDYTNHPLDTVMTLVQAALVAGKPVLFRTFGAAPLMTPDHTYVVLTIAGSGANQTITTYDPDGFYDFWSLNDLLPNGVGFIIGT